MSGWCGAIALVFLVLGITLGWLTHKMHGLEQQLRFRRGVDVLQPGRAPARIKPPTAPPSSTPSGDTGSVAPDLGVDGLALGGPATGSPQEPPTSSGEVSTRG